MADQHDEAIYAAGYAAGRDGGRAAIDCPYLPGPDLARRQDWLKGFSAARIDQPPEADDTLPTLVHTPHAG